jgi:L-threonylcarbamoyladenylate synthase
LRSVFLSTMTDETTQRRTQIIRDGAAARERAREIVERGGVVAFRTDTFYGLGANPTDATAVRAVNELKGREGKPILVIISDASEVDRLVAKKSELFALLASHLWAGALTLVAAAREGLPEELTAGTGTIGVRLPADEEVQRFVRACGGALTATSANRAGEPPSRSAEEVARVFPVGLDLVVDGGTSRTELASTVVDVTGREPRLIREGVIAWREIVEACK